jgi:hypothetical protein
MGTGDGCKDPCANLVASYPEMQRHMPELTPRLREDCRTTPAPRPRRTGVLGVRTIAGHALSLVFALAVIGGLVALLARWQAADVVLTLAAPAATVAPAQGGAAAVRTCREDLGWTRPSEVEMARTVWQDNRYRDADGSVPWRMRAYYERHFVLFTTPTGSGTSHAQDLTGLATARPFRPGEDCGSGFDPALVTGHEVAIWAPGYRVTGATVAGDILSVVVMPNQPTTRGYHIVQTLRPTATTWSARFVLADGTEVARLSTADGELTARSASEPCTGTVVGRVVADYGNHDPAVGESISLSGLDPHRPDALVHERPHWLGRKVPRGRGPHWAA